MSVAVYPVFQTEVPEFEPYLMVSGKGLGSNLETLETLAQSLEIASLMQFFSVSSDEVAETISLAEGETLDYDVVEEWFASSDALSTIRELRVYVHAHPESVENAEWVLEDLDATSAALMIAEKNSVHFHFSMDI